MAARGSDPDHWHPLQKPGIAVYNQEFLYQFNPKWQASIASSIRHQNKYEEEPPYDARDESYRWELRYYGRLYYKQQLEQLALTYAFRPEFRTFYSPDWKPASTSFELRLRLKAQAMLPLNQKKTNFLVGGNEFLSAEDEYRINIQSGSEHQWSDYHFTEDRFSLFFRHFFLEQAIVVDLGLMEQFKSGSHFDPVSYLSFDILILNPFSKKY